MTYKYNSAIDEDGRANVQQGPHHDPESVIVEEGV